MTDHESLIRIGAEVERLETKREKQHDEARRFLATSVAWLRTDEPDWTPAAEDAQRIVQMLRQELRPILEAHFPHLLKPTDEEPSP